MKLRIARKVMAKGPLHLRFKFASDRKLRWYPHCEYRGGTMDRAEQTVAHHARRHGQSHAELHGASFLGQTYRILFAITNRRRQRRETP